MLAGSARHSHQRKLDRSGAQMSRAGCKRGMNGFYGHSFFKGEILRLLCDNPPWVKESGCQLDMISVMKLWTRVYMYNTKTILWVLVFK